MPDSKLIVATGKDGGFKLPGEENEFGSTVIGNEGIKLFDDILTANSRLIDSEYDIKMDLNSNHGKYKPVKFLLYSNI